MRVSASTSIGLLKWQAGEFVQLKCIRYEPGRSPRVLFEPCAMLAMLT